MEAPHPPRAPHGQPQLPVTPRPTQYTDGYGIASIVLAFFMLTIPGLILGLVGAGKAKRLGVSPVISRVGWILNLVFLVIITLAFIGGIAYVALRPDVVDSEFSSSQDTAQSTIRGGGASLDIPHSFESINSDYPEADIAQGDLMGEAYVITYHDIAEDIASNMSVSQYADMSFKLFNEESGYTEQTRAELPAASIPNPFGHDVADYQITATYDGRIFIYFVRYVRTPARYYTLMTWTMPSYLEDNRATLLGILGTFKEI